MVHRELKGLAEAGPAGSVRLRRVGTCSTARARVMQTFGARIEHQNPKKKWTGKGERAVWTYDRAVR